MTANDNQVNGTHYKDKDIQPWDYIAANKLGYFEGNVVKYVSRWRDKGGVADLEKARHYIDKLIELNKEEHMSTADDGGVKVNDIADRTLLSRTTVFRILKEHKNK
jgi:hypothetical protein